MTPLSISTHIPPQMDCSSKKAGQEQGQMASDWLEDTLLHDLGWEL